MNDINALTPDERTVLETMACLYYPVERIDLEAALRNLGLFQQGGKPFTTKALASLLISLRAGGFGLNLTAADYVVHMDPWWNPAVEDQASDRTHRIGQDRPVTVVRLIAEGTIEDKILALHSRKRALAADLLDGTQDTGRLSVDELLNLIRTSA
jgi:hypothetical protein